MCEFVNFEAVEDIVDEVIDFDEGEEVYKNVSDADFIDDENDFDENVEDYHFFQMQRCQRRNARFFYQFSLFSGS